MLENETAFLETFLEIANTQTLILTTLYLFCGFFLFIEIVRLFLKK